MDKFLLSRQPPKMLAETLRKLATNIDSGGQPQQSSNPEAENYLRSYKKYCAALGIDEETGTTSFEQRLRRDYRWHTVQYWFVASVANGMLWAQIIIGAAITALGATHTRGSQTATIYLGAASTVIAGFLTYFKSRNQPNRARQYRQALRKVRNKMDETAREISESTSPEEALEKAKNILNLYDEALAEAAANYPDLWVAVQDMKKMLPGSKETAADAVDAVTKPEIVPPPITAGATGASSSTTGQSNIDVSPLPIQETSGSAAQLATKAGLSGSPAFPQDDHIASSGPSSDLEKQDASVDIVSTKTD
ncbi:hypothetical protein PV08_01517 [Exophiala spinifera]|uniref:SMODS and SLOG-associating 2TM effector domain-containing protein n=1 Tax=Exophiala spinifera TaxID=91928 RepID=A0A0D2BPP9_9EURO|nr:uncharacterized protein PV08_01517 [Exophiala spinifera]KIW20938.1 hypothetical protein PV08_01517 [Exophiala spinifera]